MRGALPKDYDLLIRRISIHGLYMQNLELTAFISIVLLMIVAYLGISIGLWPLDSFLSYIPQILLTGIIGLFIWGFRKRIKSLLKTENRIHYHRKKQNKIDGRSDR
jgi:hypothetical protein